MRKLIFLAPVALAFLLTLPAAVMAGPEQDYQLGMTSASKGDMPTAIAAFTRIIEAQPPIEARNLAAPTICAACATRPQTTCRPP